jgi:flagellar basal body rod protein FlgB
MKEEELMKQEIVKDCDERLRAASADFQEQLARALERGKDLSLKEQAASTQRQASEHEAAMDRHRLESRKKIAELETRNQDLEREMKSIRENVFSLEASLSGAKAETDLVTERLRHVENKAAHVLLVCRRVDEVLLPELSSCLITLNNIESEMAFVHAHTVRAFALNSPGQKPSSQALKDVHRSKDVGFRSKPYEMAFACLALRRLIGR